MRVTTEKKGDPYSDFHITKKKKHTMIWDLFLDVHKLKFDISARPILRPKQL